VCVCAYEGEENADYEAKKVHLDNLYRMVQYCENSTDCRRSQQMAYFGEIFDRRHCSNMKTALCDNCASKVRNRQMTLIDIVLAVRNRDESGKLWEVVAYCSTLLTYTLTNDCSLS